MSFGSCHLRLETSPFQGADTETFRLGDYKHRIELIYSRCLERVQGYNGGSVIVGEQGGFYAYLGAGDGKAEDRNETISTS